MQRYQSLVFDFFNENTTGQVAPLTKTIRLNDSLNLKSGRILLKPKVAQLSTRIPNIYSYGDFNNRIIQVKRNVADAWTKITLTPGVYKTVTEIEAAITEVTNTWYTDPQNNPALTIQPNNVTDQVYFVIDSTKLAAGGTQMCVDLSQSQIAYTLGYPAATTLTADGVFASSEVVRMDAQGTYAQVVCDLCNMRVINGTPSKVMMTIPLTNMTGLTEYVYPGITFSQPPDIVYTGSSYISNYTIEVKTYDNRDMVFMKGSRILVSFELCQEI